MTITEHPSSTFKSAISKVKRASEHIRNIEETLSAMHEASTHALTIAERTRSSRIWHCQRLRRSSEPSLLPYCWGFEFFNRPA